MINKLTNDAMRGTPWPATLDEAYLQASTWHVQTLRKDDKCSESATYVIADTVRKKKVVQFGKEPRVLRRLGSVLIAIRRGTHLAKNCPDKY